MPSSKDTPGLFSATLTPPSAVVQLVEGTVTTANPEPPVEHIQVPQQVWQPAPPEVPTQDPVVKVPITDRMMKLWEPELRKRTIAIAVGVLAVAIALVAILTQSGGEPPVEPDPAEAPINAPALTAQIESKILEPRWTWVSEKGDFTTPSWAGLIVIRQDELMLVSIGTGEATKIAVLTDEVTMVAPAMVENQTVLLWTSKDKISWKTVSGGPVRTIDKPDDADIFTAGSTIVMRTPAGLKMLRGNNFADIPLNSTTTLLGTDDGALYAANSTTLLVSKVGGAPELVSLEPPRAGLVPIKVVAASWEHSFTLWQEPGTTEVVGAVHVLKDTEGSLAGGSVFSTTESWNDIQWGPSRMSVTSGKETVWLSTTTRPCNVGELGISTGSLGSALSLSTSDAPALLTSACKVVALEGTPTGSDPAGNLVLVQATTGEWFATKVV